MNLPLLILLFPSLILSLSSSPRLSSPINITKTFRLIANLTNPSLDLSPSVQGYTLTSVHVGAGLETAVLSSSPQLGSTLYENATGGLVVDSSSDSIPFSMVITPWTSAPADQADYVNYVGLALGEAQTDITMDTDTSQVLYKLGTFIVCEETNPTSNAKPQYPVRFAAATPGAGGVLLQKIPGGCVPITLLAECIPDDPAISTTAAVKIATATANEKDQGFGGGVKADSRMVRCYDDAAAVRWS
ncbi:hypothetical protein QBC35DRAFT_229965 [Podospora australis]|uniref:DUF7907 domain-containing protein n=1 Tax=Podospora australis TaxID=1536484 RepID=A0AAN6WX01_9PEZI|nr:hypothetical protein QBC35DRAFT_229965 [Podospora australis]